MKAADLLSEKHPLHATFVKWLRGAKPTRRKAREFLQQFPMYR